jgi:hypothetical protein
MEEAAGRHRPAEVTPGAQPGDRKAIFLLSSLGAFIAGLCCFAPIVLVLFGLATVSAANSLGNKLYGENAWLFRLAALLFLVVGLVIHFRRRGICTLDEAKRQRTLLFNVSFLVVFTACALYIFWNYVVLHYWGIAAGLPWAQWDESWAIPTSAVLLTLAAAAFFLIRTPKDR